MLRHSIIDGTNDFFAVIIIEQNAQSLVQGQRYNVQFSHPDFMSCSADSLVS
jgi:hypothetical protein